MGLFLFCNNPIIDDVDVVLLVLVVIDSDDDKNNIDIVQTKQDTEATTHLMEEEAAITCMYCCYFQVSLASQISNVENAHYIVLNLCNVYLYNFLLSTKWKCVYMIFIYALALHIMEFNRF